MDFADSLEHAAFRSEFRRWLEADRKAHCVAGRQCMPPAGSGSPGPGYVGHGASSIEKVIH
jgi:hypothetical protein